MGMFFERAELWGSGQGLERVETCEKTGKGVRRNSGAAWAGDSAGFVLEMGPSPVLLAGKMLLRW